MKAEHNTDKYRTRPMGKINDANFLLQTFPGASETFDDKSVMLAALLCFTEK